MNPTNTQQSKDIVVIGLEVRTEPARAFTDIPALWARFARDGVPVNGREVYAVYCDYEKDGSAPYTMVLGFAVDAATEVPKGLRRVRIPSGRYARFEVKGQPQQALGAAWGFINGAWEQKSSRRFIADAERYLAPPAADGSVHAEVLVGVD